MNNDPVWLKIQKSYKSSGLRAAFVEVMGWELPSRDDFEVSINNNIWRIQVIACMKNYAILQVDLPKLPDHSLQRSIAKRASLLYPEAIFVYQSEKTSRWVWPRRTSSGSDSADSFDVAVDLVPAFLAQRLSGLMFSVSDHRKGVTLAMVRDRVKGNFDTSAVTASFYRGFQSQHSLLQDSIIGLPEDSKRSYATLILNRLMFIYFLQKKEFLNRDPDYLRTCLAKTQQLQGSNKFYSFYRDYLLQLFFEALNNPNAVIEDESIRQIIGDVKYINGGIFGANDLENAYNIEIPDDIFAGIFDFFDSYIWHLDTRPTGNEKEINPEVIGYIFEQYINFTTGGKKENGAYYTKHDVTGYMVNQTLVPKVLDLCVELGLNPFGLLISDPNTYIQTSLLHGWDYTANDWLPCPQELKECWENDPTSWSKLDNADWDETCCLPGETWVETFYRRNRAEKLRSILLEGTVSTVDDLITHNLDSARLLTDLIHAIDDGQDLIALWGKVTNLSIIDPTCGSGAFLFAALEVLEVIYSAILANIKTFTSAGARAQPVFELNKVVASHPNERYFVRKHAALNNLYGTDLMGDAIETAKLRIFLSLAACLERVDELEPLPDLDFNLKVGNLIVGFKDEHDVERVSRGQVLLGSEFYSLQSKIGKYVSEYQNFLSGTLEMDTSIITRKKSLKESMMGIRSDANEIYAKCLGLTGESIDDWVQKAKPFHWFAEFPQVISTGGFDVVIGNPPYVARRNTDVSQFLGYETDDAPDLYAVCYERSLTILKNDGRHAFIVMLNLAFSHTLNSLRLYISGLQKSEWWTTYSITPSSLFSGVKVRNTILVLGNSRKKYSTVQQVFTSETRLNLFANIEYFEIQRQGNSPPLRTGIAQKIVERISATSFGAGGRSGEHLGMRVTGTYWYPVLPSVPRLVSSDFTVSEELDRRVLQIPLYSGENRLMALAVLAGKLGYLWWSATGDDFDTKISSGVQPRLFAMESGATAELIEKAREVENSCYAGVFVSNNAGWNQANIRWSSLRAVTDQFDREFLESANLKGEWRNLNIWYRQVMKSTRENLNGVLAAPEMAYMIFND